MARSNPTPSGNGLDTFRTWETMALGRVAVVLSGQLHEDVLFAGLPVVRVPSWPAEAAAAWMGKVWQGTVSPGVTQQCCPPLPILPKTEGIGGMPDSSGC